MISKKWTHRGEEPTLNDVMRDPIIALVMKRDNLKDADVWSVIHKAQQNMEKRTELKAA